MSNTTEQRYLCGMTDDGPHENPALSRLYGLAEAIVTEITLIAPDWCHIERDARDLADAAQSRCSDNELTRK